MAAGESHQVVVGGVAVTVAISVSMVITSSMTFVVAVLAPFLQRELGLSVLQIGLLAAGVHIVASALSTPAGYVTDRMGGRRAGMLMIALATAAFLSLSQAPTYGSMLASVGLAGCATAFSNPATNDIIVGAFPAGRQGWAVGWKQAGVPIAATLAGVLVPSSAVAWGWRSTVAGIGAAALVLGVLALLILRGRRSAGSSRVRSQRRVDKGPRPVLSGLNLLGFLMGFSSGCVNTYTVLYIVETLGYLARTAGFVAALAGLSGVMLRVAWPVFAERRSGARASLRLMAPVACSSIIVLAVAPYLGGWLVWIGGLLSGAIMVFNSLGMLAILREVPRGEVGSVTGALSRAFFGGLFLGPLVFGALVDASTYRWAWGFTALVALLAVAVTRTTGFLLPRTQPIAAPS